MELKRRKVVKFDYPCSVLKTIHYMPNCALIIVSTVGDIQMWVYLKFRCLVVQIASILREERRKDRARSMPFCEWDSQIENNRIDICEIHFKDECIECFSKRKSLETGSIPRKSSAGRGSKLKCYCTKGTYDKKF